MFFSQGMFLDRPAVAVNFLGIQGSTSMPFNSSSWTFSGLTLAGGSRHILAIVGGIGDIFPNATGVIIGGSSATRLTTTGAWLVAGSAGGTQDAWIRPYPSGTSVDIEITFDDSMDRGWCAAWEITNLITPLSVYHSQADDGDTTSSGVAHTRNINTIAGGATFSMFTGQFGSLPTYTWSGALSDNTKSSRATIESSTRTATCWNYNTTTQTGVTTGVSANAASNQNGWGLNMLTLR